MITVRNLTPFPANDNPFHHDLSRMGSVLGTNVVAMFEKFDYQRQPYLIIVNLETGERIEVNFDTGKET